MNEADKANRWNAANPVGTMVMLVSDNGDVVFTRTRSKAGMVGNRAVVCLEGLRGCFDMDNVRPAAPDDLPKDTGEQVYFLPSTDPADEFDGIKFPRDRLTPWRLYRIHTSRARYGFIVRYVEDDQGVLIPIEGRKSLNHLMHKARPVRPIDLSGFDAASARVQHVVEGLAVLALEANARDFAREAHAMVQRWERTIEPARKAARLAELQAGLDRVAPGYRKCLTKMIVDCARIGGVYEQDQAFMVGDQWGESCAALDRPNQEDRNRRATNVIRVLQLGDKPWRP